jgi:hypothetical protein
MVKICVHDVAALRDPQFFSSAEVVWHVMYHCRVCGSQHGKEYGACILMGQGVQEKMALCSFKTPGIHCQNTEGQNTQLHCCGNLETCARVFLKFVSRRKQ